MTVDRSELYFRFSRQQLWALLAVVVVLGLTALGLMLSPAGAVRNPANLVWWLTPVVLAGTIAIGTSLARRRWDPGSPEVKAADLDEWRRHNTDRASRVVLFVVLAGQWPLALLLGEFAKLPPPRGTMVMATASLTLGLALWIVLFLFFDRD